MSAQGGAGSQAPTSLRTTSALDYGWWASDGPTAGYLVRRAIDALEQSPDAGRGQVRHAHVQVLRLAVADPIDISVARASGTHGIGRVTVTFEQGGEFAVATLTVGPRLGHSGSGDGTPPAALPLDAYVPMITRRGWPRRRAPRRPAGRRTGAPRSRPAGRRRPGAAG